MSNEALVGLINNAALLLALSLLYGTIPEHPRANKRWLEILAGFIIGLIGIAVMVNPWELIPGVVFDTRSILLSVGGLFFGLVPTVLAALMTALFRVYLGGLGTLTGVVVIVISASLGLLWRRYRHRWMADFRWRELYAFGIVVQIAMLLSMLTFPWPVAIQVLSQITLPVLLIYPLATVLLGNLLAHQQARRSTMQALQESEERLRQIVQNMPVMLDAFDSDYNFVAWNQECERVTGYTTDEIIGAPLSVLYPDEAQRKEMAATLIDGGYNFRDREWNITCKDGSVKTISWSNISMQFPIPGWFTWAIGIDVTARKKSEDALQASEAYFRALIANASDVIIVLETSGVIRYCSPSALRILGRTAESLTGKDLFDLVHEDDAPTLRNTVDQILPDARAMRTAEIRLKHRTGTWPIFETVVCNLVNDPPVCGIVVNARNITARRRLEEQLNQAQRMESIGQLAGGLAHDLNNLLVPIMGFAELGMAKLEQTDRLYRNFKHIHQAGQQAADLTKQILAFSRRQMLEMKVLDIDTVIAELQELLQRLLGEEIEFIVLLDAASKTVRGDRTQIEQVLVNLAINARDAMPVGGKFVVETSNVDLDVAYAQQYGLEAGPYVMLTISDTGYGMDATTKQRIFEPFFTTKEQGQGTGLGLATVFGTIKQHRGHVLVYSEPGQGATFKILLPRLEETVSEEPAPVPPISGGNETILVVEDEDAVRTLVCETLATHGYHVMEANGPDVALSLSGAAEHTIHLLLTDVILPDMVGPELYRQIAKQNPGMKVLYMSGYSYDVLTYRGLHQPRFEYLQKPFSVPALLHATQTALRG